MAIDEMKADIEKRYFDWLYELVCGKWEPRNLSFHRLLTFYTIRSSSLTMRWTAIVP